MCWRPTRLRSSADTQLVILQGANVTPLQRRARELGDVEEILASSCGGVHKMVDRNRALLELLVQEVPDFMLKNAWLMSWFRAQDKFLSDLASLPVAPRVNRESIPRPFPAPRRPQQVRPLRLVAPRFPRRSK